MYLKDGKMYVDWPDLGDLFEALARKVVESDNRYDLVLAILRGGAVPALVVADRLNIGIDFINIKSYLGVEKRIPPRVLSTLDENLSGKRILVVDDLVDKGETAELIIDYLKSLGVVEVHLAVVFYKPTSKFKPNFFVYELSEWIVFPWEINEIKKTAK